MPPGRIDETEEADPITQDLLVAQTGELEQFRRFVRAHLENAGGSLATQGGTTEREAAGRARAIGLRPAHQLLGVPGSVRLAFHPSGPCSDSSMTASCGFESALMPPLARSATTVPPVLSRFAGHDAVVIRVSGEIDTVTVDQLDHALAAGFNDQAQVLVDLTGVSFMGDAACGH